MIIHHPPQSSPSSVSSPKLRISSTIMQDANEILRGGLFTDRRLRVPTNGHHQALNCPRCNSLNTKFCYYNNYNLSQPRYFCKNCRRYWTKGGVLRNVPVGGGCRKSKRSSKRKIASSSPKTNSAPMAPIQPCSGVNANFDPFQAGAGVSTAAPAGVGMFAEIEGFGDEGQHNLLGFGEIETTPFEQNQLLLQQLSSVSRDWQKEKIDGVGDDWGSVIYDQISNSKIGDEVLAVPDWNGDSRGGDGGMFDLTHGSEWSESSQWNESDHHLYLPP